jgi:protein involved in polysaccharide export with SLBB domain
LPATGTVAPGDLVYGVGPLRITAVAAHLAEPPQPGSAVLTATSTTEIVQAALPVADEYLVKAGDQVSITLPGGSAATPGVVASISTVASVPSDSNSGGNGGPGNGSSGNPATVQLTVTLTDAHAAGNLDQAPVTVNITSAQAAGVLAVPIGALVALGGGGYAVTVIQGTQKHLVAVTTGLYSDTLVQVSGAGLASGTAVEVPST